MSGYSNVNMDLSMDDFLVLIKKLYYFIRDSFRTNEDISSDSLVCKYSSDEKFLNHLDYIKNSLDVIDELMENINFTYDEYYNFLSIKDMIVYIAGDVGKYLKYCPFILSLLNAFNLLLDSQDNPDYENIYEKFDIFLDKKEDFFYTQIFESDRKYDELTDKVCNILG